MSMQHYLRKHHFPLILEMTLLKSGHILLICPNQKWILLPLKKICRDAVGENLYQCINDAICSDGMSAECKDLNKIRTMVIIYIMIYSQSQRSNSFQVTLARTLQQFGISEHGLRSLGNLGIAALCKD